MGNADDRDVELVERGVKGATAPRENNMRTEFLDRFTETGGGVGFLEPDKSREIGFQSARGAGDNNTAWDDRLKVPTETHDPSFRAPGCHAGSH